MRKRSSRDGNASVSLASSIPLLNDSQIFGDPSNLRRVFLGVMLQFSVQMTGVSCIQYYAPQIFEAIGFNAEKTFLFQVCAPLPQAYFTKAD